MPSRNQKKRSKQRAEYLQKQDDILSQENKAKARARYKADREKKKASVRDSYKADTEKKKASVRDSYKVDPEKKKASVRDSYKADPEKKKAFVRNSNNADIESKQSAKRQRYQENLEENRAAKRLRYQEDVEENHAAKRQRYQEDVEENRAAKRQKYEDNSAAIKASERNRSSSSSAAPAATSSSSTAPAATSRSSSRAAPAATSSSSSTAPAATSRSSSRAAPAATSSSTAPAATSRSRAAPAATSRSRSTAATTTSPTTGTSSIDTSKALSTSVFDVPTFTPQASSEGQLEVPLSGLVPVSLSHTPPSFDPIAGLPARPVKRILKFEFVEMADMLPDAWQEESQSGTDGNPMVRRLVRRAPLTEITLWLEGFARLASVLTTKHPTKSAELWAYQSAIIRATRNFEGTAWVAYDRQFRREALARKDLNWSVTNSRLNSEAFTGRAKIIPRCRYCLSETHDLRACSSNPDTGILDHRSSSPYGNSSSKDVCRNFNDGKCRYDRCKYRHVCRECFGPHPWCECSRNTRREDRNGSTTYPYTRDLMRLQSCPSLPPSHVELFEGGRTPLILAAWEAALARHPDRDFAAYICSGIRFGFRIGFVRSCSLKSASANMFSSFQHPDIIQEYISKELDLGRMLGPLDPTCYTTVHINRFGVVPKGHNTGKWRLITDLSYPPGHSVNDGIDPELCSLHYTSVDDMATVAAELGQGALMTKVDIEAAYRLVPVHPHDRPLLGMEWKGQIFADPMLPFGLRSAPKIFNAIADALEWYLKSQGSPTRCMRALSVMRQACVELGIPLAEHKTEGPATRITFLGIMIDTTAGQLSLPPEKLALVQSLLADWGDRKSCSKKELESLIGPTSEFASDASGSWGCGAHTTDSWIQIRWDEQSLPFSITIKELLPIMVAAVVWGTRWRAQKVLCHCDNQAVVAILNSRSSFSTQRESGKDSHPATGDPGRHVGGLDVTNLDTSLQGYFRNGLAPSTHRSYDCALRRFNSFCVQYNVSDPFPVTEKLLCYFSTKLANDGLAPQTIKVYLSAIRSTQLSLGLPLPHEESSLPVLKRVLDGIRRTRASECRTPRIRLPITVGVLRQIHTALGADISEPDGLAFWAIATSAFFGFFRLGELLMGSETEYSPANHLSWGDVALDTKVAANMVKIHLKKSKCDQCGTGVDVLLGREVQQDIFSSTEPENAQLRGYMKAAGLPSDQFAGHSFRIGAATTATRAGIEDSMIQTLGRWHSAAFLRYIRTSHDRLAALSVSLAKVD
eukprot:Em0005g1685a